MDGGAVQQAIDVGRRAWPGIELDAAAFRRHLSRVLGSAHPRSAAGRSAAGHAAANSSSEAGEPWLAHAADLYLACACTLSSWGAREALQSFHAELRGVIVQVDGEPRFVTDTFAAFDAALLGPRSPLARYDGRGPLLPLLSVFAARSALNALRRRRLAAPSTRLN